MLKKILPFILALPLLITSCSDHDSSKKGWGAVPVKVATVESKTVPLYRDGIGYVRAPDDIDIFSQVQGEVTVQHFKEGNMVKKGDLLYTIDPRPYQAKLDGANAEMEQIEAEIAYQESLLERYESLVKKEYVSQNVFDKALSQLKELQASLRDAKASKFQAEVDLDYCYIKAPIDGVTGITYLDPGVVITDTTKPLVSLRSMEPIFVDFVLPQQEINLLRDYKKKSGEKGLTIVAKTLSGVEEKGTLKTIQNAVDTQTGTINLRGEFENKNGNLWPGEYVEASLHLKEIPDAVLVPQSALRLSKKGSYVYVVKHDKTVEVRPVELGQRIGSDYVASKGLKKGEIVVVLGQLMLTPGATVTW